MLIEAAGSKARGFFFGKSREVEKVMLTNCIGKPIQ